MSGVRQVEVRPEDAGLRLDRWFRRSYPALSHGRLEKLLRTGQIRIDGRRAKAGQRLAAGQTIRVPPLGAPSASAAERPAPPAPRLAEADRDAMQAMVLHKDDDVIALDKPPGLAVQGGTGTRRHLDAMLDALRFGAAERPRLVHRLDKDTSGVLLIARGAKAAAALGAAFRDKSARKIYWALSVGVPEAVAGRIDLALAKLPGRSGERVVPSEVGAKRAITDFVTVEAMGKRVAWLALRPVTGRTHQLRAHCAAIGTPILGDGKYGGAKAFVSSDGLSRRLHLHAREIALPHPRGGTLRVVAPLPPHMRAAWDFFGFDPDWTGDPFAAWDDASVS